MKQLYIFLFTIILSFTANCQVIVIDPEHGYGAITSNNPDGRTATEIETALEVGLRTKTLLTNNCASVVVHMTRTTNINGWISVDQRALMAQNWNADRLISMHGNAGGGTGTETFYSTATGLVANNESAAVQLAYATKVQDEMVLNGDWLSRRVSTDISFLGYNLGVLKRSTTGCLNEIGFVDSTTDAPKLLSSTWRDKFALAYFNALKSNLNMTCNGTIPAPGSFSLIVTPSCNNITSQVNLTWTASTNTTSYDIYRNGVLWDTNITATTYVNTTNVVAGTTYSYSIKAKNTTSTQTGNSNGTLSVTAINCALPGAFTLTVTPECNVSATSQNKLTWTTSANATAYDIYRNGVLYDSDIVGNQYINSYLITGGTTYTYSVKAKNTIGKTSNSNGILSVVAISCIPGAFTVTAFADCSGTTSRINLTWTVSAGATSYDIYRNGNLYASDVTGTQFLNTYLIISGTTYTYSMVAKNSVGTVANSNGTRTMTAISCLAAGTNKPSTVMTKNDELMINNINIKNEITLHPNPTEGEFILNINNVLNRVLYISIFNLTGQNVYTKNFNSPEEVINKGIDIRHLPNGIYLMKISVDGKEYKRKIIKK
ncbi:N-acetylmuramoyl-L-alanine amidase [Flavobacterium sp.]|uniref:N-acetylmuramoyl-L-alanine amidase n=1 Tax=Flavobacterium sp. TaxID=239 RepID=UPI0037524E40